MENNILDQAKSDYDLVRKKGDTCTTVSTVILGALFDEIEKTAESNRISRKESEEGKFAIRKLHELIVGETPFYSWQRVYQTYEQKQLDNGIILGALDTMACALSAKGHNWSEGEREIYKQATEMLGAPKTVDDVGPNEFPYA